MTVDYSRGRVRVANGSPSGPDALQDTYVTSQCLQGSRNWTGGYVGNANPCNVK